jgi:hypothetical protein
MADMINLQIDLLPPDTEVEFLEDALSVEYPVVIKTIQVLQIPCQCYAEQWTHQFDPGLWSRTQCMQHITAELLCKTQIPPAFAICCDTRDLSCREMSIVATTMIMNKI